MSEYKVSWEYAEDEMSEQEDRELINGILQQHGESVKEGGRPLKKSAEEGLVQCAAILAVHSPETLVSVYQLLKDTAAIKRVQLQDRETGRPLFQIATGGSVNVATDGDVIIHDVDGDYAIVEAESDEELLNVQRENEDEIVDRLDEEDE